MNVVIIEDEVLLANEMKWSLAEVDPDIHVLAVLPGVKSALEWFGTHEEPDLIFADIQLSDGISFEIFEKCKPSCPIIFATAYDEYALRAFKVNGIDYLLKPVDTDDLRQALDKVKLLKGSGYPVSWEVDKLLSALSGKGGTEQRFKEKFIVKFRNQWMPVSVQDIAYFIKEQQVNFIYTLQGDKYILDLNSLEDVEELVDPKIFFRANRQCILAIHAIQSYKILDTQKVLVLLKAPLHKVEIDISREKAAAFRRWFEG